MGANTMVAAIGLVLGPVLGGALVAISWHWVFWFNVPLALAGAAWGAVVLRELARHDGERGLDLGGTLTFVLGLTALVLRRLARRPLRLERPVVIGGFAVAAVLLPAWVMIEHRGRAPMLDLDIFSDRLFAAAGVATFINGLVRFALMFIFVFYFQGAQGDSPITAGLKLAPLAIGMLIASPLAGRYADAHGSRALAAVGMLVTAGGLALMTPLAVGSSFALSATALAHRRSRVGHVHEPEHGGDDGRGARATAAGVAAGARMVLHEHRLGALDRVRARHRDRGGAEGDAVSDLLRARPRARRGEARRRSSTTCTSRCGLWWSRR